jgi:hypothetical protein
MQTRVGSTASLPRPRKASCARDFFWKQDALAFDDASPGPPILPRLIRGTLCHSFHVSPVAAAVFYSKIRTPTQVYGALDEQPWRRDIVERKDMHQDNGSGEVLCN